MFQSHRFMKIYVISTCFGSSVSTCAVVWTSTGLARLAMSTTVITLLSSRILYVSMASTADGIPGVAVHSDPALRRLAFQTVYCGLLAGSMNHTGAEDPQALTCGMVNTSRLCNTSGYSCILHMSPCHIPLGLRCICGSLTIPRIRTRATWISSGRPVCVWSYVSTTP